MVLWIIKNTKKVKKKSWTNREYHVQHNKYVEHQEMKMYCDTNQFTKLKFLGPHDKPQGVRGLCKHYHTRFDTKLGHGTYEISFIPFACT